MKYYFITYQGTARGHVSTWNQVIDTSPMEFIKLVSDAEKNGSNTYNSFVVINTCEITSEDYIKYKDEF